MKSNRILSKANLLAPRLYNIQTQTVLHSQIQNIQRELDVLKNNGDILIYSNSFQTKACSRSHLPNSYQPSKYLRELIMAL